MSSSTRKKRMIWFISLGSFVALIAGLLWFGQRFLVFMPSKDVASSPAVVGLAYEDVTIETDDGVALNGWFVPASNPRGSVLYCHGNGGNIGGRVPHVQALHELDLNVLIFDYRGYGNSGGRPSEKGTYRDVEAAYDYLLSREEVDADRVLIWGRSLGGAIALYLATERDAAGLVLESTFTSLADVAKSFYPYLPVGALLRFEYPSAERISSLGSALPILIAHAKQDSIVPYEHGEALFELAPGDKRFVELIGDHNEAHLLQRPWRDAVASYLDHSLGPRP